jgi:hypothetical protein
MNFPFNKYPTGPVRRPFTVFILALLSLAPMDVCCAPATVSDRYAAMAIQGDLSQADELFSSAEATYRTAGRVLHRQFSARFMKPTRAEPPATGNAFADEVTQLYRQYWRASLLTPDERERHSTTLNGRLAELMDSEATPINRDTWLQTDSLLSRSLRAEGFHVYAGYAPPLQDLILWRHQRRQEFTVQLTDTAVEIPVVFIGGMISRGWKDYASLGLSGTTGWVHADLLYCVDDAYDIQSEAFEVSFLRHEARHLVDLERYPELSETDLEYRAKLTELAFADHSMETLLRSFSGQAADTPDSPHAQASFRLVHAVYRQLYDAVYTGTESWKAVDRQDVRRVARALLDQSLVRNDPVTGAAGGQRATSG